MLEQKNRNGLKAELLAELRANELGYMVSRPVTGNCRYDMIIDNGTEMKRIQVKHCAVLDTTDTIKVSFRTNSKHKKEYSCDEIDAVVVYVAPVDRLCYLPIELVEGRHYINLRMSHSARKHRDAHYCEDYYW